jgi:hypothetical protein
MNHFQRILKSQGIKYCFEVVKPIVPFTGDVQAKIDFAIGKENQVGWWFVVGGLWFVVALLFNVVRRFPGCCNVWP